MILDLLSYVKSQFTHFVKFCTTVKNINNQAIVNYVNYSVIKNEF